MLEAESGFLPLFFFSASPYFNFFLLFLNKKQKKRYDLTKEECLDLGECSSLCDGQSCRSVDGKRGACVAEGASDCQAIGGEEVEGECILEDVATSYACDQVFSFLLLFLLLFDY